MQRNQIIGGALIGVALLGFVGAFTLGRKPAETTKPAASTVKVNYPMPGPAVVSTATPAEAPKTPVTTTAAPAAQWQHFQCRRGSETLSDFKQARAEFMGRKGDRVYWRVFTPTNNSPTTAHNFNINPSRIVCSYVKS